MYASFFFFLLSISCCLCQNFIVNLGNGKIQGLKLITFANTSYYSFQKIPFAAPPVGNLRFKAPQPAQNWEGILNATSESDGCYQQFLWLLSGSEDCLFLNVYTPQLPVNLPNASLPVMLFIHGGAYAGGSSSTAKPDIFVDSGVILVTINYRLGIFGFLSTGDEAIPGNNGLKDQHLALQWTHDNIHLFGGDPGKITIFGQSAGSSSVSLQLLNQNNKGLFRAAILESGVSIAPWTIQRNGRETAFGIANRLNSTFETVNNTEELLQFLQNVEAEDLIGALAQQENVSFLPVIQVDNPDAFITKKMYGLLEKGEFLRVPTLVGVNSEESLFLTGDPVSLEALLASFDLDLSLLVPDDMRINDPYERTDMGVKIRNIYTNREPFADHLGSGVRFVSDNLYNIPGIKYAELVSKYAKTYFYMFSYDGKLGIVDVHYDGAESVAHGEELAYLFCSGKGCDISDYPESDDITRKRLVKLWTDFAKYLDPTPEPLEMLQNITWPQVNLDDGNFLYLNINDSRDTQSSKERNVQKLG